MIGVTPTPPVFRTPRPGHAFRTFSARSQPRGCFAVLVLALLATIALTAQAWIASRAQRRSAEEAVRDYARFAANNYAMDAQLALRQSARAIFSWLGGEEQPARGRQPVRPERAAGRGGGGRRSASACGIRSRCTFFDTSRATNELKTVGPHTPSQMETGVLRDSVRGDPKAPLFAAPNVLRGAFYMMSCSRIRVPVSRFCCSRRCTACKARRTRSMASRRRCRSFSPRTFRTITSMQLLPPSLTKGVKNDSLFSVKVWDDHRLVYESR